MTEKEREELINAMAKSICALYKLNQNDWREWKKECRAALAVAEPVIRDRIITNRLCASGATATCNLWRYSL